MAETLLTAHGLSRTVLNQNVLNQNVPDQTGAKRVLWRELGLGLYPNERLAVTGPSGSGKSLLLRALAALDPLESGSLHFRTQDVQTLPVTTYRTHVLYLPQRAPLYPGTVEDNLRLPFTLQAHRNKAFSPERVTQLFAQLGRSAAFLSQAAERLSGGEAQLVALVRALSLDPVVLLLDEATSALDPDVLGRAEGVLLEWTQTADHALLWVGHDAAQRERLATRELALSAFYPVSTL